MVIVMWLAVVSYATDSVDDTAAFSRQVGGAVWGGIGSGVGSIPGWMAEFRANQQAASKNNTPSPPPVVGAKP